MRKPTRRLAMTVLACVALVLGQSPPSSAHAATFAVDSTADALDANTADGVCQTGTNTCTLRAAIMQANALGGSHTIALPAGTYTLTLAGAGEDAATLGDLDVTANITLQGAGAATTTVNANQLDRVFDVRFGGGLALSGVTVTGGSTGPGGQGGGIQNAGLLTLANVVVTANAASLGGGVANVDAAAQTVIAQSTISSNSAVTAGGGVFVGAGALTMTGSTVATNTGSGLAIGGSDATTATIAASTISTNTGQSGAGIRHIGGSLSVTDSTIDANQAAQTGGGIQSNTATLTRVTINNNRAIDGAGVFGGPRLISSTVAGNIASGEGGGIYNVTAHFSLEQTDLIDNQAATRGGGLYSRGNTPITGGTIRDNRAADGAGIYIAPIPPLNPIPDQILTGVTVRNNNATGSGGGLNLEAGVRVTLANATVRNNQAGQNGGGIFTAATGTPALTLNGVTLDGNSAANGGGIWQIQNATLGLVNTTVSGNTATSVGGGLGNLGTAHSTNVTYQGNVAPAGNGGNVFSGGGTTRFLNAIVANGAGGNCAGVGFTSQGNNLDTGTTCAFAAAGDRQNANPNLGPLAFNGGPTQTHALGAGSQAIDAGANAGCPGTDQRGVARPRDGDNNGTVLCDVGAFEADGSLTPPGPCEPRPPVRLQTAQTGPGTLQVTVSLSPRSGGAANQFERITFDQSQNATIEVPGQPPRAAPFPFEPGAEVSTSFIVRRVNPGAFTVRLTVVDACGSWPTFVGGGPAVP